MLRSLPLKLTFPLFVLLFAFPGFAASDAQKPALSDALELGLKSPGKVIDLAPYRDKTSAVLKMGEVDAKTRLQVNQSFGRMPLLFEKNEGQTSDEVKFLSRGRGYNFYLTPTESVMVLSKAVDKERTTTSSNKHFDPLDRLASIKNPPKMERAVVRMQVVGANEKALIKGEEKLASTSNYFVGNDQSKWRQGVANYKKVHYEEVYAGIDLVYYGNQSKLEYDFIVKPGANPNNIELNFKGADKLSVDDKGNLILETKVGDVVQHAPVIYQTIDGKKETVKGEYVFKPNNRVAFHITSYDPNHNLVIDPVLGFSTYLGGSDWDEGLAIAVDENQNIYVAGRTNSPNFNLLNEIDGVFAPFNGSFIFKLEQNENSPTLVFSTFIGSAMGERLGIAIDTDANIYLTGGTNSSHSILKNAIEGKTPGGSHDVYLIKLEQSQNIPSIAFSTYLGGSEDDFSTSIALDDNGNIYVAGFTESTDFDLLNEIEGFNGGQNDVFVFKVEQNGNVPSLGFSTYVGGNGDDRGNTLAADDANNIYVSGFTKSSDFNTKNEIESYNGDNASNIFLFKLEQNGNIPSIAFSTYIGGSGFDGSSGVAIGNSGNIYLTGGTDSFDFDLVNQIPGQIAGSSINFVMKLEQTNNIPTIAFSTLFGGTGLDSAYGIALDDLENVYVAGSTNSLDFDVINAHEGLNPPLPIFLIYEWEGFVFKMGQTANVPYIVYSTYLGGVDSDNIKNLTIDKFGSVYVTGNTWSQDFDLKNEIEGFNGVSDVFVTKLIEYPNSHSNDFNHDSFSDVLAVHSSGILVSALIENSVLQDFALLLQADPAAGWTVNATGDFNGDKKADLLLYNTTTGEYRTVLLDGTTVLSDTVVFTIDPVIGVEPRGVGDFDGDGEVEIIIYHPPSGFTGLVYMTGGAFSSFEEATTIDVANNWTLQDTGHFNGDNKTDFLITNTVTGESAVIEMDGSTPTGPTSIFTFDPTTGWEVIDTGDFNGDGKSDVLILHATGALGVLVMDGLVFQSFYVPGGLAPGWELVNVGNYDGINKADFLIHDTNTGDLMTAVQDGATVTTYTPVLNLGVGSGWSYHGGKP